MQYMYFFKVLLYYNGDELVVFQILGGQEQIM